MVVVVVVVVVVDVVVVVVVVHGFSCFPMCSKNCPVVSLFSPVIRFFHNFFDGERKQNSGTIACSYLLL